MGRQIYTKSKKEIEEMMSTDKESKEAYLKRIHARRPRSENQEEMDALFGGF